MIQNYLKVAWRAIFRNKLTAFINIAGLAIAIACALLIYLFVNDELSYDRYHSKADRIYRINRSFHSPEGVVNLHLANVAPPIGPLVKNDFGEVEVMARTINFGIVVGLEENGEIKIANSESNLYLAEPDLFKIFDIDVTAGDASTALNRPFTVMLSEKTANRYFNSTNVIGKRLRANNAFDLEVTGVYKDFPLQAHWHPDFLVSFSTLENDNIYGRAGLETNWGNNAFGTYVLLQQGADPAKIQSRLPAFLDKHFGNYARTNWGVPADWVASKNTTLFLQKVTDIHLRSHLDDELETNGDINNVYMMSVIGLFIVLIACFNFINLSTARATKRAKEVGLRKVVGALKNQLVGQYVSESMLTALLAFCISVLITGAALPSLNGFTGKDLSLQLFLHPSTASILLAFVMAVGLLAGTYPAFILSSFNPVVSLKGQPASSGGKGTIRKALVVSQFAISIALIIATLITFQQLNFLNTRSLGYERDQVVTLPFYGELSNSYDAFYQELTKSTRIENVARSSRIPTGRLLDSYGEARILKDDSLVSAETDLKTIVVDAEFFDTYGIAMKAGRNFSKEIPTDDSLAFIVNEAAAKAFGWTDPSKNINQDFYYNEVRGKLVGIVSDFHFESLHQTIVPMIFLMSQNYNSISLRISGEHMQEGLALVESQWKSFLPGRPFTYSFLSERYKDLYSAEQKQSQLFTTFSILAIFIASLGLFGLATFNTLQRIKEIGIRKVLGASVSSILALLSKEIILLIGIANLIAWPAAWYFMDLWLKTFAYHIDMTLLVYGVAAVAACLLALITISLQTIKAAISNPASTLHYE